jgi:hypothetical protein
MISSPFGAHRAPLQAFSGTRNLQKSLILLRFCGKLGVDGREEMPLAIQKCASRSLADIIMFVGGGISTVPDGQNQG